MPKFKSQSPEYRLFFGICVLSQEKDEDKLINIDSYMDDQNISITEFEYLTKQKKKLENNIKSEKLDINQKMDQIVAITNSITKALMQRKQLV